MPDCRQAAGGTGVAEAQLASRRRAVAAPRCGAGAGDEQRRQHRARTRVGVVHRQGRGVAAHCDAALDCGKPALNEWLTRHERQAHASGSSRTFAVVDEQRIAGNFSRASGQINSLQAAEPVRKGSVVHCSIPEVIFARHAASQAVQGRGVGVAMLRAALGGTLVVAEQAGVRALLTHPIDNTATRFYTRIGFEAPPDREQQWIWLLKDTRRLPVPSARARFPEGGREQVRRTESEDENARGEVE